MIYPDILAANAFSICSGRRMGIDVKTQVYEEHKSQFLWKRTVEAAVAVATLVLQGSSSRHE